MLKQTFIEHDFELPNHTEELKKAEEIIEKYKNRLKLIDTQKRITGEEHTTFFEEIVRVLDYVGRLSTPAFNIEEQMELLYIKQYPRSPHLAKKLFNDHYENVHHPYNLLKNRCFKLLEDLDAIYYKCNKKHPPNWNI